MQNEAAIRDRAGMIEDDSRIDRSVDERERDDFYDLPDYDNIDFSEAAARRLQLYAPDARVDEVHGLMHQRWVNVHLNNGRRVTDLRRLGYVPRNPNNVPRSFGAMTEKWQGKEVIMVAGDMMLMEIPAKIYRKFTAIQQKEQQKHMAEIQKKHGTLLNSTDNKLSNPGEFMRQVQVTPLEANAGENISFDD